MNFFRKGLLIFATSAIFPAAALAVGGYPRPGSGSSYYNNSYGNSDGGIPWSWSKGKMQYKLTKENFHDLDELKELMKELGLDEGAIYRFTETYRGMRMRSFRDLMEYIHNNRATLNFGSMSDLEAAFSVLEKIRQGYGMWSLPSSYSAYDYVEWLENYENVWSRLPQPLQDVATYESIPHNILDGQKPEKLPELLDTINARYKLIYQKLREEISHPLEEKDIAKLTVWSLSTIAKEADPDNAMLKRGLILSAKVAEDISPAKGKDRFAVISEILEALRTSTIEAFKIESDAALKEREEYWEVAKYIVSTDDTAAIGNENIYARAASIAVQLRPTEQKTRLQLAQERAPLAKRARELAVKKIEEGGLGLIRSNYFGSAPFTDPNFEHRLNKLENLYSRYKTNRPWELRTANPYKLVTMNENLIKKDKDSNWRNQCRLFFLGW